VLLSYHHLWVVLATPIYWARFVKHLLAIEPSSVWLTQRGLACWQTREPQEKNHVFLFSLDISQHSFGIHIVIISCHVRYNHPISPLHYLFTYLL
jgi:hypothetical protein